MKKAIISAVLLSLAALAAVAMGLYVYPGKPWVVWALLFVCWACYRLRMRAVALFSGPAGEVTEAES